jgi:hypothetical protein
MIVMLIFDLFLTRLALFAEYRQGFFYRFQQVGVLLRPWVNVCIDKV